MKLTLFLLIILLGLTLNTCKTTSYPATAEVRYIDSPSPGLINLEATGYGKTEYAAELYLTE